MKYHSILKYCLGLLILVGFSFSSLKAEEVEFYYFSEQTSIEYDQSLLIDLQLPFSDASLRTFYDELNEANYQLVLDQLQEKKNELRLNDWLFYLLIRQTGEEIYKDQNENYSTLFSWFILAKTGYKLQLNYANNRVLLNVHTLDQVQDIPVKKSGRGWMAEISSFHSKSFNTILATVRSRVNISKDGRSFSFKLDEAPRFKNSSKETVSLEFVSLGHSYHVDVMIDKTFIHLMYKYPELTVQDHVNTPLSISAFQSLIPQFKSLFLYKSEKEALRILLSFTRQAFLYENDLEAYKLHNLTFSPEEVLYYRYSDCEDRVVLFSHLVKEILGLDVILIEFDEHIGVGVKLANRVGKPILHNDHFYTYCDPTGPEDALGVGSYPRGLKEATYIIRD